MNILITAGNTQVPIDRVRVITNIFSGKTGTRLAEEACQRGHRVTLLTSHPELAAGVRETASGAGTEVFSYKSFDQLQELMAQTIRGRSFDAIIHCAAVSDYNSAGIFAPAAGTQFDPRTGCWDAEGKPATLIDRSAGKVKSDEPELWLRLVRTPKLVDQVRAQWGFAGILVKFKLEVDKTEEALQAIAEQSRLQSAADLMVANTLEGMGSWAYLGPFGKEYVKVGRRELATRLLDAVETLHREGRNG